MLEEGKREILFEEGKNILGFEWVGFALCHSNRHLRYVAQ
jgi:hypothetical protein